MSKYAVATRPSQGDRGRKMDCEFDKHYVAAFI